MRIGFRAVVGLAAIALAIAIADAGAQVTETPVAFDSAGRVRTLTPALATRLELRAPAWPVTGTFREARLFGTGSETYVLTVERNGGAVERYPLNAEAMRALRAAVDNSMRTRGALVTEAQTDLVSEPAKGKFVRNQMVLSALLYSPAFAAQMNDGETAAAVYLLTTGASYFIVSKIANATTVSRTQTDLSTDGAVRGAFFAQGIFSAFGPETPHYKTAALVTLGGALGGTVAGFSRARGLTEAEGKAAKSASTYSLYTVAGLMGITGVNDSSDYRATAIASVGAGMAGYLLGPRYPKRSAYTVTAGDINTLWIGSTLGVATAFIPLVGRDSVSERLGAAAFTAGLLGGALIAERTWVRRYDHSQSDVAQMWLGTLAGALMGGAVVILSDPNETGAIAMVTAGGLLGAIGSQQLTQPERARSRQSSLPMRDEHRGGASVEFSPASLAMAASHVRGRHGLLTIRF
jgi:hypothetical protein